MPTTTKTTSLEDSLRDLADSIGVPPAWKDSAKKSIDKLFEILKRHSKYGLDRCRLVGGFKKGTSTCLKVDVDTVIYFNDPAEATPRSVVLEEWEDLLLLHTDLQEKDIRRTDFTLTFVFKGVPFDLIPVPNRTSAQGPGDIEMRQMAEDIRRIKSSGNPIAASKTLTLSPQSAEWMRGKSEFCHQIARLAKFWAQTIIFDKKVFGMSYIFELIAVKAALEEEEEEARGGTLTAMFVAAFHRFLTKVANLRVERIIFTENFRESDIPAEVLGQSPLLIDPVNRYQNLLELAPSEFFDTFVGCASKSLERLQALLSSNPVGDLEKSMALIELFKPQPLPFELENPKFKITRTIVGPTSKAGMVPQVIINRDPNRENVKQNQFANTTLVNLSSLLNLFAWRYPNATCQEMQDYACSAVDTMTGTKGNWVPTTEKHESRAFTFVVPTKGSGGMMISFDLD